MKRKKWTEEEEQTLLHAYSSTNGKNNLHLLLPVTRQKRFQPIADRVNSLHHLPNPSSYPFLWSWRDIAIKIHNMRHQFLNVKKKITTSNNPNPNWDHALDLWPNFLLYKQVFGDANEIDSDDLEGEEEEAEGEGDCNFKKRRKGMRWRERLRREEKREEEEMEWMERVVAMQMEHEKQAMQMHADACQAQLQILGILVRVVCQFLGPGSGGGGDGGLPGQVVENLQAQQRRVEEEETDGEIGGG